MTLLLYLIFSSNLTESISGVYGDHFVGVNVTVNRGIKTVKMVLQKEKISTLFVDFYHMPASYTANFTSGFCRNFIPALIEGGHLMEDAYLIVPSTINWTTVLSQSDEIRKYFYSPVEIPRNGNLLYLVTSESIDEMLRIGCIPENTSAQTMMGITEWGKMYPFLSLRRRPPKACYNFDRT